MNPAQTPRLVSTARGIFIAGFGEISFACLQDIEDVTGKSYRDLTSDELIANYRFITG